MVPGTRIYLDANIFIFLVEGHPLHGSKLGMMGKAFSTGALLGVTSRITLAECLGKPLKEQNHGLIDRYSLLFEKMAGLEVLSVSDAIILEAAKIRARCNLPLVDAIHAATALEVGCGMLLSEDKIFQRVTSLSVTELNHFSI